jgi:hypothetical protein
MDGKPVGYQWRNPDISQCGQGSKFIVAYKSLSTWQGFYFWNNLVSAYLLIYGNNPLIFN